MIEYYLILNSQVYHIAPTIHKRSQLGKAVQSLLEVADTSMSFLEESSIKDKSIKDKSDEASKSVEASMEASMVQLSHQQALAHAKAEHDAYEKHIAAGPYKGPYPVEEMHGHFIRNADHYLASLGARSLVEEGGKPGKKGICNCGGRRVFQFLFVIWGGEAYR